MKRLTWSLTVGIVILFSGSLALLISAGLVRRVRAQAPPPVAATGQAPQAASSVAPGNKPPPPSNDLPPPAADLPPPAPGEVAGPEEGEAPAANEPNRTALDSSQDPGLKSANPEGYVYDPSGRRDPFLPPKELLKQATEGLLPPIAPGPGPAPGEVPLAQGPDQNAVLGNGDPLLSYYIKDFKLIGVLWDVHDPRAMIRAPNNNVYTVHLKTKLGRENAVIAAIREKEVVLVQPDENGDYKKGDARFIRMRN